MKRNLVTMFSLLSLLISPAPAFAAFSVAQGGTGQTFFTAGSLLYGNGTNPLATTTPGTLGYVLQYNGTFPTWVATSSLGLVTHPAGNDQEIQFNDNGSFGSDSALKWDKASGLLTLSTVIANYGIRIRSSNPEIFFGNGVDFNTTSIGINDQGQTSRRLVIFGAASTTNVEIAAYDGASSAILDTHLLHSAGTPRFAFPDIPVPNGRGTFGLLELDQTWTGNNTFSKGTGTTTMTFGTLGDTLSKVCFNTKNTDGADISFYFVGTSMVVANNSCQ
jgi:hypothetical protein